MNAASIRKVIRLRFRRLNRFYTRMKKNANREDIHRFRVEVKKLRAFLRLLQDNETKIKLPRPLKEVYRRAGKLRDLQLHHQTIRHIAADQELTALHSKVNKKMAAAIKYMKKAMSRSLLQKAQQKIEKKLPGYLSPSAIQLFYDKKIAAIPEHVPSGSMTDKQLHAIRKNLKDILYNAQLFETDLSRRFPASQWNKEKEKHYTALADELGQFQDSCVALAQLRRSRRKAGPEEKQTIIALQYNQQQLRKHLLLSLNEKYRQDGSFVPGSARHPSLSDFNYVLS